MGIATATAIGLGLTAASTGYSIYKDVQASKAEADANKAAATAAQDTQRLAELDKYLSLNVPTLGLDLATQNMQAWQQSQIQALKEAGAAGVLGGLTNVNQQVQAQNRDLAVQADDMKFRRDAALAENAQQIESNRLARQAGLVNARMAGAQTAAAENRSRQDQAQLSMMQGLASGATLLANDPNLGKVKLGGGSSKFKPTDTTAVQKAATDAFKPQMAAMAPNNIRINNPTLNQAQTNLSQANFLTGLRGAQAQYEASQLAGLRAAQGQFDSQYQFNPFNNQWTQNAPY